MVLAHDQYYFFVDDHSSKKLGEALFRQTLREADEEFYATFPQARLAAEREGCIEPVTDYGSTLQGSYNYLHNTQIANQTSTNQSPFDKVQARLFTRVTLSSMVTTTTTQAGRYLDVTPLPVAPVQVYQGPLRRCPSLSDAQPPQKTHHEEQLNLLTQHAAHKEKRSYPHPYSRSRIKSDDSHNIEHSVKIPAHKPSHHLPSPTSSQMSAWTGSPSHSSPSQLDLPPNARLVIPLIPLKRQIEKKPPLACLFCRVRKIACGVPLAGSADRTCNQCQRRCLQCEYPSESRRGMRRKNTRDSADGTTETTRSTFATQRTFPGEGTLEL